MNNIPDNTPPPVPRTPPPAACTPPPPIGKPIGTPPPVPNKPQGISAKHPPPNLRPPLNQSEEKTTLAQRKEELFESANKMLGSTTQDIKSNILTSKHAKESYISNGNGHSNSNGDRVPRLDKEQLISSGVREMPGYVGFANIPNQLYRKAIKRGFDFTLMVVGQSGLGKSTFINSLFLAEIYPVSGSIPAPVKTSSTEETTVKLCESGVTLNLTLIDTPGFGDNIDNSKCWDPILNVVDAKCSDYLSEETKINRRERIADKRVHCCLYFIAPNGHGLRSLDIEFMKQLHDRVNVIPVIAKADTMTPDECAAFKKTIMHEIKDNKIKIYEFPDPEDEDEKKDLQALKDRVPFAVVGSNMIVDVNGRKARCRQYPWGKVEVENLAHSDFVALRNMLIRTHLMDLMDVTKGVHYENFRVRQMANLGKLDGDKDPFSQMEEEKTSHALKLKQKKEEMERVFQGKVQEKLKKQGDMERDYQLRIDELKAKLERRKADKLSKEQTLKEFKQNNPGLGQYDSKTSLGSTSSEISKGSPEERGKMKKITSLFSSNTHTPTRY